MPPSKTLSLRLSPVLYDRLATEAAAQGKTRSKLAVECLLLGLDLPPPPPAAPGQVVAAVVALFDVLESEDDLDLRLRRELALVLAEAAEREQGATQVHAVRELRAVAREAVGEVEDYGAALQARWSTPRMTDAAGNEVDAPSPNGSGQHKEQQP